MQKEDISLLRIYAKNDMNCVKTAKEMDIHHNSVIYRLGKIKTETGLDARKFWDLVKLLEMEESCPARRGNLHPSKGPVCQCADGNGGRTRSREFPAM